MTFIKYSKHIFPIVHSNYSYSSNRANSIAKLNNGISNDPDYFTNCLDQKLMVKKYTPAFKSDVNRRYGKLISLISQYFNVYSVWVIKMIPGTIEPIRTVWTFGYKEEVMLAAKYIAVEINNLEQLRFSRQQHYRKVKRRGRLKKTGVKTADARTKALNHILKHLDVIEKAWEKALESKPINIFSQMKYEAIAEYMKTKVELDYKNYKYKGKPRIQNAFCKKGKFQKNKIIMG